MYNDDELEKEFLEELMQSYEFEEKFYDHLAGGQDYQIILYPDPETREFPSEKAVAMLKADAYKNKYKLLFKVQVGSDSIIYDSESGKLGIMPKDYKVGFEC